MPYFTALLLVVILGASFWLVRKYVLGWMKNDDDMGSGGGTGFSLADLRQLHKSGKMTDEEFERAKAQVVQGIQAAAARQAAAAAAAAQQRSSQFPPQQQPKRPPM